jgi:hypothetical protein
MAITRRNGSWLCRTQPCRGEFGELIKPLQNDQITILGRGHRTPDGPSFGLHLLIGDWTS